MEAVYQVILAVCFFFGVAVIIIMYLDGRFSHKHEFTVIQKTEIRRAPKTLMEVDIPVSRIVYIQQCHCGKMKKHTIDVV